MAGLAGDDLFFGDDGNGEEFCYGTFDVEEFCYGTFDPDDDGEEFCYGPSGGDGGDGGGEEFCVSGFSVADLSDLSSSDIVENQETDSPRDYPLPQTLAGSSSSRSFDSDGDLGHILPQLVSAMRLSGDASEEEEEEELGEVLGYDGGGEGLMVSGFDLDTPMVIGGLLGDLQVVMGTEEVLEEDEEEATGNGGSQEGFMPNGFDFGPPRVISGSAVGFRMLVNANDTDSDDFEFVEVLAGQVGEAASGASKQPLPVPPMVVESLPEAMFSEEEASRGCAVCKDCFASGQLVALLPCKHYFHGDCIWPWLAIRKTCPVCRHQLCTDDAEYQLRMARRVVVLVPVEHQDALEQNGGVRTTMGAEGATEFVAEIGPEQSSS